MAKRKINRTPLVALLVIAVLPAFLAGVACMSGALPAGTADEPLTFRIENATASTIDVTIEMRDVRGDLVTSSASIAVDIPVVTVSADSVSFSTLEPIGAAAAALAGASGTGDGSETISETLNGQATVRVPGYAISEGYLLCGVSATISAITADTSATVVTLTGAGTGTPGFDEGSIGESGQRFLINGDHFACGDAVVVRIDDDGAGRSDTTTNGTGDATTNGTGEDTTTGSGQLAVVEPGSVSPFDPVVDPGANAGDASGSNTGDNTGGNTGDNTSGNTSGDASGDPSDSNTNGESPVEEDVTLIVSNTTANFISVSLVSTTQEDLPTTDIFLPAAGESIGTVSCADTYTITAKSLATEALTGLLDEVLIMLQGDGTGTVDFDSGSIGNLGQRLLEKDIHFVCGDTIEVVITDAGEPGYTEPDIVNTNGEVTGFTDINGNNVQDEIPVRLGSGTVQVK